MPDPLLHSPPVQRFADLAERLVRLVADERDGLSRGEWLARAQELLPALYSAALSLPAADPTESGEEAEPPAHGDSAALARHLGAKLAGRDLYAEIFDCYELDAEPVMGTLSDDFADIHRDLTEGLAFWRRGAGADAAWTWRFLFETHWGEHALGALRAIHTLAYRYDLHEPGETAR